MTDPRSRTGDLAGSDRFILIVEDDPGASDTFSQILKTNGFDVRVAFDTESGLIELERAVPAAILLDLHLPTTDGLEFLRQLRGSDRYAGMPIAVVTGDYFVDDELTREIEMLGAPLRFKPLWEEDLLQLVNQLLPETPGRA